MQYYNVTAAASSGIAQLDSELLTRKSHDLREKLKIFQTELGGAQRLVAEARTYKRVA